VFEGVWTFVMEGKAPDAVVAGLLTFDDLAYFWRWHKSGEIIKADELALIMLNVNVESTSQPCLAICWVLGVIGTARLVLVMPMLYVLHFQSPVYQPWSSKWSTCGDYIGREAVLHESVGSITYSYSRSIVIFRVTLLLSQCSLHMYSI
jgi:hypothetical protein